MPKPDKYTMPKEINEICAHNQILP